MTGPPNERIVLLAGVCRLSASSVIVCNAAGGQVGRPPGVWAVGRSILHGGPVPLRPVVYYERTYCLSSLNKSDYHAQCCIAF